MRIFDAFSLPILTPCQHGLTYTKFVGEPRELLKVALLEAPFRIVDASLPDLSQNVSNLYFHILKASADTLLRWFREVVSPLHPSVVFFDEPRKWESIGRSPPCYSCTGTAAIRVGNEWFCGEPCRVLREARGRPRQGRCRCACFESAVFFLCECECGFCRTGTIATPAQCRPQLPDLIGALVFADAKRKLRGVVAAKVKVNGDAGNSYMVQCFGEDGETRILTLAQVRAGLVMLSASPQESSSEAYVEEECVACMDSAATRVFIGCRHQCYCNTCWKQARDRLGQQGKRSNKAKLACPICRTISRCKLGEPCKLGKHRAVS